MEGVNLYWYIRPPSLCDSKTRCSHFFLHIWFATTGRKNKGIKKVGKGLYQLKK
jgi:hypothetical protein